MNKKEMLTPKERVVSFKKKRGYFIRSEYAHSYMLFFFGIVGTFFIETGDALNLFCRHLQNSSIMEMVMSLSVYTWIKYAFKRVQINLKESKNDLGNTNLGNGCSSCGCCIHCSCVLYLSSTQK